MWLLVFNIWRLNGGQGYNSDLIPVWRPPTPSMDDKNLDASVDNDDDDNTVNCNKTIKDGGVASQQS